MRAEGPCRRRLYLIPRWLPPKPGKSGEVSITGGEDGTVLDRDRSMAGVSDKVACGLTLNAQSSQLVPITRQRIEDDDTRVIHDLAQHLDRSINTHGRVKNT